MLTEAVTPIMGGGWCGNSDLAFQVSALPVTLLDGRAEVLFHGVAPDAASIIQLTSVDGTQLVARPVGATRWGRPWVIAAPLGLEGATVTWLDERGRQGAAPENVSDQFNLAERQQRIVARSDLEMP